MKSKKDSSRPIRSPNTRTQRVPATSPLLSGLNLVIEGYRCPKCKFIGTSGDPPDDAVALPSIETLRPSELWRRCPNENGEVGILWNPRDRTKQRTRFSFWHEGKIVRVCSPRVTHEKVIDSNGRIRRCRVGAALSLPQIQREFGLVRCRRQGVLPDPDLQPLWWYQRPDTPAGRLCRAENGEWFVPQASFHEYGEWANRVLRSTVAISYGHPSEFMDLLRRAYPSVAFGPIEHALRLQTTVWAPIDLRLNLERQLEGLASELRPIRKDLLRLSGKTRARPIDNETAWRNLYCYMLSKKARLSPQEIAAQIFPRQRGAAAKVRSILSQFRRRLSGRTAQRRRASRKPPHTNHA